MTSVDLLTRIPAVEDRIDCRGAWHRLGWAAGSLTAPAHPDAHGERVLGALGAARPRCLQILDAWAAHEDDLRVLTVGPRHAGDQVGTDFAAVEAARHGNFARHVESQRVQQARMPASVMDTRPPGLPTVEKQMEHLRRHLELLELFTLPASLQHRLLVTVAARQLSRPGATGPAMTAALVGRAGAALRSWAGDGSEVDVRLGSAATVQRVGHQVFAELPTEWLVAVWGMELALVEGHFVCEVMEMGPERCTVRAMASGGEELELPLGRIDRTEAWTVLAAGR